MSEGQSMVVGLALLDLKKKGWTKVKLIDTAKAYNVDIGTMSNSFHQLRASLIAEQKKVKESCSSESSGGYSEEYEESFTDSMIEIILNNNTHNENSLPVEEMSSNVDSMSSLPPDAIDSSRIAVESLCPNVDITEDSNHLSKKKQEPVLTTDLRGDSKSATQNKLDSNSSIAQTSRTIGIKTTVFEQCKEMCESIGIPNADIVALNFLCERSLPPDCHDKNDDDQSKATNAASRAMGVLGGEPYFPQDIDVMNRDLKIYHHGEYVDCEHDDFPEHEATAMTNNEASNKVPPSIKRGDNVIREIRRLWLKIPIFQSRHTPYRNEVIEFAVDSNTSKMLIDVDRTIRSLINVHNSCGISKRNDKMNAYYFLNSNGDVMLLNSGLLSRCPLKTPVHDKTTIIFSEPLYLCHYDAIPGENPRPAVLRNREWSYVFPYPELYKFLALVFLMWFQSQCFHNIDTSSAVKWSELFSEQGFHNLFFMTKIFPAISPFKINSGVQIFIGTTKCLQSSDIVLVFSTKLNALIDKVLSPLFERMFDFSLPAYNYALSLLIFQLGYLMLLVIRIRSKLCLFHLMWMGIDRYWYIPAEYSVLGIFKGFARIILSTIGIVKPGNGENGASEKAVMRIRFEDHNTTRFIIFRWICTSNFDEDFEVWSSTLRAALGISTSSQNDPDMLISDPKCIGVRIALSAAFLKFEMYKSRRVFNICKPGQSPRRHTKCLSKPHILLALISWVWIDIVYPQYYANSAFTGDTNFSPRLAINCVANFFGVNTLCSLIVSVIDAPQINFPRLGKGFFLSRLSLNILAILIVTLFWK